MEHLQEAIIALLIGALFAGIGGRVLRHVRADFVHGGALRNGTLVQLIALFCADAILRTVYIAAFAEDSAPAVLGLTIGVLGLSVAVFAATAHAHAVRRNGRRAGAHAAGGPYRYSRNPHILGYLAAMLGYTLLWPTVAGLIQLAVLALLLHRWVKIREDHLALIHGEVYRRYRNRTGRYVGRPRR
ncbi:MAG TPA: methyltransferase [Azospirillum sp.]